jgi:hypothetical protein
VYPVGVRRPLANHPISLGASSTFSPPSAGFFMLIHKAELYDLAGNKLPQRYVCYLPYPHLCLSQRPQGALLGMTRREVEAKIAALE